MIAYEVSMLYTFAEDEGRRVLIQALPTLPATLATPHQSLFALLFQGSDRKF